MKNFIQEGEHITITAGADIERGLAAFQSVYADSWKSAEPHPGFIPGLSRLAAQQGWLRLGVAWLADEAEELGRREGEATRRIFDRFGIAVA
jgi:hypothetical protein